MTRSPPTLKQVQLPADLPKAAYSTWHSSLADMASTQNARHAAERFQFLCGYLQALKDAAVISERMSVTLRGELLEAWTTSVNHIDQSASDVKIQSD